MTFFLTPKEKLCKSKIHLKGKEKERYRETETWGGGEEDKPKIPGMLKLAMKRSALDYL